VERNLSFHAACLNNMDRLRVLIGQDPNKVNYGKAWIQLQKKKDKDFSSAALMDYTQIIKILSLRYNRVMKRPKVFLTWYKQNKNSKEFPRFLMWMVKKLKSKNKSLK